MMCTKCDEGVLVKIKFKKNGKEAFLCDFCEALWFADEDINIATSHTLRAHQAEGFEYTLDDMDEKDQEHRSAQYTEYK